MNKEEISHISVKILLSSRVSEERLDWIEAFIGKPSSNHFLAKKVMNVVYLCGDALYSLIHPKISSLWIRLGSRSDVSIFADSEDLADLGLSDWIDEQEVILRGSRSILFTGNDTPLVSSVGFLHLYGPYMHRYTDQFLGFMQEAMDLSLPLSVILYLDGVHLCHKNQVTSEFSNIEQGMDQIRKKASDSGVKMIVAACQRCSQARGYLHHNSHEVQSAPCFRDEVEISGLSTLIPYFSQGGPVFSADSADVSGGDKEAYIHVITGSPYGTEHTFGAISWAVALSGKDIPSYVIFAEDGAYAWIPTPDSRIMGTVRDIHAVIEATSIPGLLEYYILESSLSARGISTESQPHDLQILPSGAMGGLKEDLINRGYHVRMLIW